MKRGCSAMIPFVTMDIKHNESLLMKLPSGVAAIVGSHLALHDHTLFSQTGCHMYKMMRLPAASPRSISAVELRKRSSYTHSTESSPVRKEAVGLPTTPTTRNDATSQRTRLVTLLLRTRPSRLEWDTCDLDWTLNVAFADSLRHLALDTDRPGRSAWTPLAALRRLTTFENIGQTSHPSHGANLWHTVARLPSLTELRAGKIYGSYLREFANAPLLRRLVLHGIVLHDIGTGDLCTSGEWPICMPTLSALESLAIKGPLRHVPTFKEKVNILFGRLPALRSVSGMNIARTYRPTKTSFTTPVRCPHLARVDLRTAGDGLRYILATFRGLTRLTIRAEHDLSDIEWNVYGSHPKRPLEMPVTLQRLDLVGFQSVPNRFNHSNISSVDHTQKLTGTNIVARHGFLADLGFEALIRLFCYHSRGDSDTDEDAEEDEEKEEDCRDKAKPKRPKFRITCLTFRRCALYGSFDCRWSVDRLDLDDSVLDLEAIATIGGIRSKEDSDGSIAKRSTRVMHLRVNRCRETVRTEDEKQNNDDANVGGDTHVFSGSGATNVFPESGNAYVFSESGNAHVFSGSGNVWQASLDPSVLLHGYSFTRPLAVSKLARQLPALTRLEYAGVRCELRYASDSNNDDVIEAHRDWMVRDICATIAALPRLECLSLRGLTSLTTASRIILRTKILKCRGDSSSSSSSPGPRLEE
jgi:hypothetical protein